MLKENKFNMFLKLFEKILYIFENNYNNIFCRQCWKIKLSITNTLHKWYCDNIERWNKVKQINYMYELFKSDLILLYNISIIIQQKYKKT